MTSIQSKLDEIASQSDNRTTVFDIQILETQNGSPTLGGRLLDESQLETLSHHFQDLQLDTAPIRILRRHDLPRMHVRTNLTGLYERPTFGMPLSSELLYGTELEILDEQERWVFTRQKDGYLGWAYKPYLAEDITARPTHFVLAPSCELHAHPDAMSEIFTRIFSGTGVAIEETDGKWAKVKAGKTGWMPVSLLRAISDLPESIEEKRKMLIEDSMRLTGVPYLWGGASGNGIDCSGFVRLLHRWVGVDIRRDADMQYAAAKPVEQPFDVGDLFFFAESESKRKITHVGMSLGGWRMIHSSRGRNGVYIDDLQERQSLKEIYVSAGSFLR
ncbi:MAG: C40 family peptidase [Anaerolineales bacterium]